MPQLSYEPVPLRFGTSGLRGLAREMTDLEVFINTRGFLAFLGIRGGTVAIARDLRHVDPTTGESSSPRLARAVAAAILDAGALVENCGTIPTPALAAWGLAEGVPTIMVTGSHIPADRNGVKFFTRAGEVLKSDEAGILRAVDEVRVRTYAGLEADARFDARGRLTTPPALPPVQARAEADYVARYLRCFEGARPLAGKSVVLYQHSAVGRGLMVDLLRGLGADVVPVRPSETFVPVDTEDVHAEDLALFAELAAEHPGAFAILSTDGDGDRPLVVDERGHFHRGDALGVLVAERVGATFAAVPISASDALELYFAGRPDAPTVARTRIGSPYVIAAMQAAAVRGGVRCGWEANGGFLTASPVPLGAGLLSPLPTRDAVLPILAVLLAAAERDCPVSALFEALPARATGAGLIDNFPNADSRAILAALRPSGPAVDQVELDPDGPTTCAAPRALLGQVFSAALGFGAITRLNYLDGVRVWFESGEIAHIRPSGNAPQLRIYAVSDSPARTEAIVQAGIAEPDGLLRQLARHVA
jgi:phosphomannomutase